MRTKVPADLLFILPEGISLEAVLGFNASYFLSANLLKPIAEFLAKIIHKIMIIRSLRLNWWSLPETAREKPMNANGMAKTV